MYAPQRLDYNKTPTRLDASMAISCDACAGGAAPKRATPRGLRCGAFDTRRVVGSSRVRP
jgi:hypothetical protein